MTAEYIHGSSDSTEAQRLEKQAHFASPFILEHFTAAPGMRVLDLATGVGAMAGQLLARHAGITLCGVNLSAAQLGWARKNHPEVPVLRADASRLPFADDTFDRVHCSWLLEHVPQPLDILREARRVLKKDGIAHFVEVDNSTFEAEPKSAAIDEAWAALNRRQIEAGGNPYIARELGPLFAAAGFSSTKLIARPLHGSAIEPTFFRAFVEEFAEIFESADEALPALAATLRQAAEDLRELTSTLRASLRYCSTVAQGTK